MQGSRATRLPSGQSVAQRLVPGGTLEQSVEQRAQVKASTSGEDRHQPARRNRADGIARHTRIFAGGE